jgi:hypothetical protein
LTSNRLYLAQKTFRKEVHRALTVERSNERWQEPRPAALKWVPRIRFVLQAREARSTDAESWRDATELGMEVYLAAI